MTPSKRIGFTFVLAAVFFGLFTFSIKTVQAELPLRIGADQNGANRFLGGIARYSFYRSLTPEEIQKLAETAPDAAFPIIEGRIELAQNAKEPLATKKFGTVDAITMDGSHWLEFSPEAADNARKLNQIGALEAWIWLDEKNTGGRIFDRIPPGSEVGWLVDMYPDRKVRGITQSQGVMETSVELPVNQWVHVAALIGEELAIFVNGKSITPYTTTERVISDMTPPARPETTVWCSKPARNWVMSFPIEIGRAHV